MFLVWTLSMFQRVGFVHTRGNAFFFRTTTYSIVCMWCLVNQKTSKEQILNLDSILMIRVPIVHWAYWLASYHVVIWREKRACFWAQRLGHGYFDVTNCASCKNCSIQIVFQQYQEQKLFFIWKSSKKNKCQYFLTNLNIHSLHIEQTRDFKTPSA